MKFLKLAAIPLAIVFSVSASWVSAFAATRITTDTIEKNNGSAGLSLSDLQDLASDAFREIGYKVYEDDFKLKESKSSAPLDNEDNETEDDEVYYLVFDNDGEDIPTKSGYSTSVDRLTYIYYVGDKNVVTKNTITVENGETGLTLSALCKLAEDAFEKYHYTVDDSDFSQTSGPTLSSSSKTADGNTYKLTCNKIAVESGYTTTVSQLTYVYKVDTIASGVNAFVERLYKKALSRTPASSEVSYWAGQLTSGKSSGAQVAYGFVFSQEFLNRNLSNEAFIDTLYATMFDRSADSAGKSNWMGYLSNGLSRQYVFKGFVDSNEFKTLCSSFDITKGTISLTEARDQNVGITMFVYRCYNKALSREPDTNGLNYWCQLLLNKNLTPEQVASNFMFSQEMLNKNLSNTDFVKILYRVFLNREYDQNGLNSWVNLLNSGATRQQVLGGFSSSKEFSLLLASYGLA
ncbi:MAG TPA: DUF4214 domain-containing protein [Oscillospiraceae bacterium]|nr:DUF4214 domain-containing protein [Oscillospiraceae bacterium]